MQVLQTLHLQMLRSPEHSAGPQEECSGIAADQIAWLCEVIAKIYRDL